MPVTRRGFFEQLGAAGRGPMGLVLSARGQEALFAEQAAAAASGQTTGRAGGAGATGTATGQGGGRAGRPALPPGVEEIKISSNENPLGPGKTALDAIVAQFDEANRYPFNSTPADGALVDTIAGMYKVKPENVVLGAGSQEILKSSMRAFTSSYRGFVTAAPTFENCTGYAKKYKNPIVECKVDANMRIDLEAMIASVRGAGLVFLNNPNNPTATVHGIKVVTDFVERVRRISPDTVILIDEAYHDYVTDPTYESAIPLAMNTPNVFVARTFSKAYGMAGMRIGYAVGQTDSIKPLTRVRMPNNVSVLGVAAAVASLNDPKHIADEKARNTAVRAFTTKAFEDLGAKPSASEANFIFVDIGRPAKEFRDACAKSGVMVGRDFPPFENTHVRVSIGTQAEMTKAVEVFKEVLRPTSPSGNGGNGAIKINGR